VTLSAAHQCGAVVFRRRQYAEVDPHSKKVTRLSVTAPALSAAFYRRDAGFVIEPGSPSLPSARSRTTRSR